MRTLVLGGIRSGKSRWAEAAIVESLDAGRPVHYVATGLATDSSDGSWRDRVAAHRERRPSHWSTIETGDVTDQLTRSPDTATLIDDIGGWLTAVLDRRQAWEGGSISADVDELTTAVADFTAPLVLVSPEVGLTVHPATASGRRFADELGTLNQRLGALCERVVLVVAGQPLPIKNPGA
ncbi:bifunctional adenosylcobinamide kinase/adenosylcobinamide-phosphate guanylyltransferase [Candidatus Mycobacterium wuenschmannii]|uniref:Adenosylcobinamide kinase n=1 Tax=Candidatus Mycobacterium wuenschmannii TaxID=3027808 RepID=A0ABY8W0Y7_9MYCO|nr:bifunctional adenosylcobinamide kinase/adenosylcobinamide-phosphate guanylyltransferase [Candidatus Mycobacterium wuenschmannii]WIM89221.1 bifunctional adenosylcobinamide kinase/adenosylcobinamide-phosphate guanylyltransferase [Candidatus Mycobacterium wuenschmannii]